MKHVLFINRSYWPDVEATGQLLTELAEDLADDFHVSIVCGQPVRNPDQVEFQRRGRETRNGVTIHRVRHTRFHKASFVGRVLNMLTFMWSAGWRALTLPRVDVVVVETDPPLLCLVGRCLQIFRRARLVCYLQDVYPEVAVALGKLSSGPLTRFLGWLFYGIYRRADQVVVLSRDMQTYLMQRGVSTDRIRCIPNWVDTDQIRPIKQDNPFRADQQLGDKFVVMYSGNLGLSQRLEQLIDAAERLSADPRFAFLLIGDGANRRPLENRAKRLELNNVRFLDYQPKSRLSESLSAADLQVVFLDPRITHCLMPSKIYGILATECPVLLLGATECELADLIQHHDLGRVVAGDDTDSIVDAISELASDEDFRRTAGRRARELAQRLYDRRVSVGAFGRMLHEIVGDQAVRRTNPSPLAPTGDDADAATERSGWSGAGTAAVGSELNR